MSFQQVFFPLVLIDKKQRETSINYNKEGGGRIRYTLVVVKYFG